MREFELLQHIYSANDSLDPRVLIGPGDDMAMVQMRQTNLLAAVDQIVDGRHFRLEQVPIELIGRKAITRSLSDVAAMAGQPLATLVAATLPPNFGARRANALFDAMRATAARYQCPLIGGDLAFHRDDAHPMVCAVTVFAEPSECGAITRSGAKPGDIVCVTGHLGGTLGPDGLGKHLTFEPRIALAQQIAHQLGHRLHSMIDISDGLGRDASHIAALSKIQIRLNAKNIPCNPGLDWKRALSDGEDYELCFTAQPPIPSHIAGQRIFQVGEVVNRNADEPLVVVIDQDQMIRGDQLGWQHESGVT